MLNRFGQSIPPLLIARRIKVLPLKSREQQKFSYELTVKHGTNATK